MKKNLFFTLASVVLSLGTYAQNSSPYWSLAGNSNVTSKSKLGTTNNYSVRFYTNNKQRMIINADSGFVGIGTSNPLERLHVNSTLGANALRVQVGGSTKFLVHSEGGVSVGTYLAAPANGLYVAGNVKIGSEETDDNDIPQRASLQVTGSASVANGLRVEDFGIVGLHEEGAGVIGHSKIGNGVEGESLNGFGVYGSSPGTGVYGDGLSSGVSGYSADGYGGRFTSDNSYGIVATTTSGAYAGVFNGGVYSTTGFTTSDKNLKTSIHEFGDAMSIINKLKPQNYEFKKDAKYASLNLPKGSHYGLLAQDLEEVLPNLVSEAPHELKSIKPVNAVKTNFLNGEAAQVTPKEKETKETINIKAVNYTELIPILVKGMQELSKENEDLKSQINNLKLLMAKNGNSANVAFNEGFIKQNAPNPSNNNTVISYYTPENTRNAQILITDMKGSVLKAYNISSGEGQLNVRSGEFAIGTYNYTLYVDNNKIDTKKMIISK